MAEACFATCCSNEFAMLFIGLLCIPELQLCLESKSCSVLVQHALQILLAHCCCLFLSILLYVQVDQQHVIIDYKAGKVTCSDGALRSRVDRAMQRLIEAMNPVVIEGH